MNCDPLASTGLDALPLLIVAFVAAGLVATGLALLFARRRRRLGAIGALAVLLVAGLGLGTLTAPPAEAACTTTAPSTLTIAQTSVISGLSPTTAPITIRGTVTNNSDEQTFVAGIRISIAGVTLAAGAPAGTCDAGDYDLLDPVMPVGVTLAPHATTTFEGATIAFRDEAWNQDACQGATIDLLYATT